MDKVFYKVVCCTTPPKFGEADTCPVDQSPAKDFNIDPYTGRPTEEITKVMRANTLAEQQTAFMNLPAFKGDFLPSEVEAKEALRFMKPSLCQLPSELAEWQESVTKYQLSEAEQKRIDEVTAKEREAYEKLKSDALSSVASPAPAPASSASNT